MFYNETINVNIICFLYTFLSDYNNRTSRRSIIYCIVAYIRTRFSSSISWFLFFFSKKNLNWVGGYNEILHQEKIFGRSKKNQCPSSAESTVKMQLFKNAIIQRILHFHFFNCSLSLYISNALTLARVVFIFVNRYCMLILVCVHSCCHLQLPSDYVYVYI